MTHPLTPVPPRTSLYRRIALSVLPLLLAACAVPGGPGIDKPAPVAVATAPEATPVAPAGPAASAATTPIMSVASMPCARVCKAPCSARSASAFPNRTPRSSMATASRRSAFGSR